MPFDPYSPCPCGSGKKLKFCCHAIADDMEKAQRLHDGNQLEASLRLFDAIVEKHPENPWPVLRRAAILFRAERGPEAIPSLERLVEARPENSFALILLAAIVASASGFAANKPLIHRAFQRGVGLLPEMLVQLAMIGAAEAMSRRKYMAGRQHLVLALRLAPEQVRSDIFQSLLQVDADRRVPFPFRSVHRLAEVVPTHESSAESLRKEAAKAAQVAERGCYAPAGVLFQRCAGKDTDNAALWHNVGLCRAWDGDEAGAAEAFRRSARLETDFDNAAEIEALAQLLEGNADPEPVRQYAVSYTVTGSVGRLLSLLDESDRLMRVSTEQDDQVAHAFHLIDRPLQVVSEASSADLSEVSQLQGVVTISEADPNDQSPPEAWMSTTGPLLDETRRYFEEIAGTEVAISEEPEAGQVMMSREWWALHWAFRFHPETRPAVRLALERRQARRVVDEIWPNRPLAALSGRTPAEVAGDPESKVALAAAVIALDAWCDTRSHELDVAAVRARYDVPPPAPLELDERTPIGRLTAVELERLPLSALDDAQLRSVVNRATLVNHGRFAREALLEVLERPEMKNTLELEDIYRTLFELARNRGDRNEALRWLTLGKEVAAAAENAFERLLDWEIRELAFRAEVSDDPEIPALARHLWDHYGRKVPQVRTYVQQVLLTFSIDLRLTDDDEQAVGSAAGGLWTPREDAAETTEFRKIWLPGQD
ncbi:MAG: hypothetical protein WD066_13045 [Planctomycetaceae bacterium]